MTTQTLKFWRNFRNGQKKLAQEAVHSGSVEPQRSAGPQIDIAPTDPLLAYLQSRSGPVEIDKLSLDSPALTAMKEADVVLAVPLVSQGELIGLINLGPRMSEQEYSSDDRRLLADLASQAAPAVRVAQLVQQQKAEARERERLAQELRVARLIQQTLLPQVLPQKEGWSLATHYQPAREVGGDFYDFHYFEDGEIGIVVGDVTDKGVPAALVMATTRTLLRAVAERVRSPGAVLQRVNELLFNDIPDKMFVTCLYALLDLQSGKMQYANAGHDLPYRHNNDGVDQMQARGMPLGLMPGMEYEAQEIYIQPGDSVLFYSDGLVEAHNRTREMFGFPRLQQVLAEHSGGDMITYLLEQLTQFTGEGWQQEDDVTLVTLRRHQQQAVPAQQNGIIRSSSTSETASMPQRETERTLGEWEVASAPGNERRAIEHVAQVIQPLDLPRDRLEKIKTAVAEATMNAMEHGNQYRAELPVIIKALIREGRLFVRITDLGGNGQMIPAADTPDLELKLAGLQSPRGWGLFLIRNMVDELNEFDDGGKQTVELVFNLPEGAKNDEDKTL